MLHCAASHGHWRFSKATCLHRLPRGYTRLTVLLSIRYQDPGLEVDDGDPTEAEVPFPARAQVYVFLRCL